MSKGLVNAHLLKLLVAFSASMLILQLSHIQSQNFNKEIDFSNRSRQYEEAVRQRVGQFLTALESATLLNTTRFSKFREDSIRYLGNEQRINKLLLKIFRNEKKTLNVAITGGSNSVARNVVGYHKIFCKQLMTAARLSGLNLKVNCDNLAIGATCSDYFSRCINDILPRPLVEYDIWLAEHTTNDAAARRNSKSKIFRGFEHGDGQSLEQFLRVILSRNENLVILIPEILTFVIKKLKGSDGQFRFSYCNGEFDHHFNINMELARHYQLAGIIQIIHVPCSKPILNMSALPIADQRKVAEIYQIFKEPDQFNAHPSGLVHEMTAEFLLFYIYKTLLKFQNEIGKQNFEIKNENYDMPVPIYNGTQLFERDFEFQCFNPKGDKILNAVQTEKVWSTLLPPNSPSLFVLNNFPIRHVRKCGSRGFNMELSISHQLCQLCEATEAKVIANFKFYSIKTGQSPQAVVEFDQLDFTFPLAAIGFKPMLVQKLQPVGKNTLEFLSMCNRTNLVLFKIELTINPPGNQQYEIMFNSLIIQYRCCK